MSVFCFLLFLLNQFTPPSILPYALLMQDPKKSSQPRSKPWYRKAMAMTTLWKALVKPSEIASPTATIWKSISRTPTTRDISTSNSTNNNKKLKKCTSLNVATSLTCVCLCVPISSYTQVFQADVPPRRSFSYPPSRSSSSRPPPFPSVQEGRISTEGRKIFRGKSLTDDVLMRRFVVEEEAMVQVRRRNEMEIIRKRCGIRRRRLGPSPLRRMILAEEEE